MPRALWKGAISFGLVNIPVEMYGAEDRKSFSFSMLDKKDLAPVGYKRYNKSTGKEVAWGDIVKGYEYSKGEYVVLSEEDFKQANVKATQTVEILSFVDADAVPPYYFETPYYLEPGKRGEKGYALLRDVLIRTRRIGIAQVVIRSRQHLAALLPVDRMLVLNTLRYASEIRDTAELVLPEAGKAAGISDKELQMAERLVEDMSEAWKPAQYKDTYHDDLMKRIEEKIDSGQTHVVTPEGEEPAEAPQSAEVIDLAALLRRSLERKTARGTGESRDEEEETGRQRRAAAGKSVSTKTASAPRRSGTHRKRA
jgi:DNA end-binding protein Ku